MLREHIGVACALVGSAVFTSSVQAFDSAHGTPITLDRIDVMQVMLSPSTGQFKVKQLRGECPQEIATHTDSDFGPGQYVVQAGFAESEAAAASWTLPIDRFPLRFDLAEMLFATSNATQATTTIWGVEIWEGSPGNGSVLASYVSDDIILPHLNMPPGTSGVIVQFLIDPDDPEQIYIDDNGTHTYSVAFRIVSHNDPGSPCITSPPTASNAFPTTDVGGLDSPGGNWIDMVTGPFCVCGQGWTSFQQMPSICTPSGDWVLRSYYTPFGCDPASGACCLNDGSCEIQTEDACLLSGGTYEGDDTDCASVNCPQPIGACCVEATGACVDAEAEVCIAFGGVWNFGETCATLICFPEGACCLPDGSCVDALSPEACQSQGGLFRGDGTDCQTEDCPAPIGWCCTGGGDCFEIEEEDCLSFGGSWGTPGSSCDDPDACDEGQPCAEDVNGDGIINVDDLLDLISVFGTSCSGCPQDINGSGSVEVDDILLLLGVFGTDC